MNVSTHVRNTVEQTELNRRDSADLTIHYEIMKAPDPKHAAVDLSGFFTRAEKNMLLLLRKRLIHRYQLVMLIK